jgi:hypothetical protein
MFVLQSKSNGHGTWRKTGKHETKKKLKRKRKKHKIINRQFLAQEQLNWLETIGAPFCFEM